MPDTEMEYTTRTKLALISERVRREPELVCRECYMELGRDRASGIDGIAVTCEVSFTEEPDEGNLQVRFCEGH